MCITKNSISFKHFHIRSYSYGYGYGYKLLHKYTNILMEKKCQKEILYEAAEWIEMNWNESKSTANALKNKFPCKSL